MPPKVVKFECEVTRKFLTQRGRLERVTQTMGVTISTHNGTSVSRQHNIRNPKVVSKEPHIDPNGLHETWIDEPIQQAYDRLFGAALAEYNAKQTRPERIKSSYYKEVCEKGNGQNPCYEMIIGVYGKNADGSPICSAATGKAIMREFFEDWKERNPNLEIIGAYYHADEPDAEPHLHIDYVPVAHGYKRGLETQAGLVKALGEQGFYTTSKKETAQIQWERRENDYLTSLCEAHGLTVDHPRIKNAEHLDTETKKAKTAAESAREEQRIEEQQLKEVQDAVDELDRKVCDLQDEYHSKKKELQGVEQDTAAAISRQQDAEREAQAATERAEAAQKKVSALEKEEKELSERVQGVSGMYSEIEQFAADVKPVPFSKRVSVNAEKLPDIIELAKQGLSERTKNDVLERKMKRDMVSNTTYNFDVKKLRGEVSSLKQEKKDLQQELETLRYQSNYRQQAAKNLGLTDKLNEEIKRMQDEERRLAEQERIRAEQERAQAELQRQEKALKKGKFKGR